MSQGNVWNAERQDTLLCFNAPVFIIVQARGWLGGVVCSVQVQAVCSVQVLVVCSVQVQAECSVQVQAECSVQVLACLMVVKASLI